MLRTLALLGLAACALPVVPGCAGLEARRVPVSERLAGKDTCYHGFRYYLSRPYLVVGGRVVMRDRRMTTIDEGAVLDRAVDMYHQTIARGSLQDMTKLRDGFWKAARYTTNRR